MKRGSLLGVFCQQIVGTIPILCFYISGGGTCDPADSSEYAVSVYAVVAGGQRIHLQTLSHLVYKASPHHLL